LKEKSSGARFSPEQGSVDHGKDKQLSSSRVIWNYSQPISDNMEEAVSGVKGELAVKLYGDNLRKLEETAELIQTQCTVHGIEILASSASWASPT